MSFPTVERKPILTPDEKEEFEGYDFPFENLAFEGGGSKGLAYIGTLRVLEEVGIAKKLKRFSGSSIGAMVAAFCALGYDSFEMHEIFSINVSVLFNDAKMGYVGAGLNLYRKMGANPAHKLLKYFRERIRSKFGDPELTFKQLYKLTGRELCLTAVSLNRMDAEYLHVKTTPHMPICTAIRASLSIPGVMMPVKYKVMSKEEDVFVDGGLLHNYPVDCFDGWYLSLDKENSFLKRFCDISCLQDRFSGYNAKSIGAVLYAKDEADVFKTALDERAERYKKAGDDIPVPHTCRSRKRIKSHEEKAMFTTASRQALAKFMALLNSYDKDESGTISRQEFKESLSGAAEAFTKEEAKLLFGSDCNNPDAIFDSLDVNGNGEIEFSELLEFAERKGVDMMESLRGFERLADFDSITGLFSALVETLLVNANRVTFQKADEARTIGVNTGYLGANDFLMEDEDRDYLIQCGKVGTVYFLREYIQKHNLQKNNSGSSADKVACDGDAGICCTDLGNSVTVNVDRVDCGISSKNDVTVTANEHAGLSKTIAVE